MAKVAISVELDAVLKAMTTLSQPELLTVEKRARVLQGLLGPKPLTSDAPQEADWLMDGIYFALTARGEASLIVPQHQIRMQKGYDYYELHAPRLREGLAHYLPGARPNELLLFGRLIGDVFVSYVSDRYKTHTLHALMTKIDMVPAAIDKAFPSYLENGLLPALLKNRRDALMS